MEKYKKWKKFFTTSDYDEFRNDIVDAKMRR